VQPVQAVVRLLAGRVRPGGHQSSRLRTMVGASRVARVVAAAVDVVGRVVPAVGSVVRASGTASAARAAAATAVVFFAGGRACRAA